MEIKIEGLSVNAGLERVYGQWDIYIRSLKLTIKEIEKCDENLNKFLAEDDMRNFTIEAHSMKGLLANIGAIELSALALELEDAARRKDAVFCASALPPFLEVLNRFGSNLAEVFANEEQNSGPIEIPPELPSIFDRLKVAFRADDFSAIDRETENLDALNPEGALKEEIEKIKDAIMMMDYDGALAIMSRLYTA